MTAAKNGKAPRREPEGSPNIKVFRVFGDHRSAQDRVLQRLDVVTEYIVDAIARERVIADTRGLVIVPTFSDLFAPERVLAEMRGVPILDYIGPNDITMATVYSVPTRWIRGAA